MRFWKIFTCLVIALVLAVCFASCKDDEVPEGEVYYEVTFDSAGGSAVESLKVLSGNKVTEPEDPEKEGYIFNGWRHGVVDWDFSENEVKENITLTANWVSVKLLFKYEVNNSEVTITDYIGNLKAFRLPDMIAGYPVVAVGDRAFEASAGSDLNELIIGDNLRSVGESAFANCEGIRIVVEGELTSVGEMAFFGCDGLESITFGEGLESIPYAAFRGCTSLKSAVLSSTVKTIEENAFDLCSSLTSITAHSTLASVADSAFNECNSLKAVYYYGTEEQWANTQIEKGNEGNDALVGAAVYMYSETEPEGEDKSKYWHFLENGTIRLW